MSNLQIKKQPAKKVFPRQEVESCLRDCLAEEAENQTTLGIPHDPFGPIIDSLVVVEILAAADTILGSVIPETVVKHGGYKTVDEALADLLPKIERHWLDQS